MAKRGGYITTGERVRSYIGWAFVIALVVHLGVALVFPNINKHAEDQKTEEVQISKIHKTVVHTPPPPDPNPSADTHAAAREDAAAQTAETGRAAQAES